MPEARELLASGRPPWLDAEHRCRECGGAYWYSISFQGREGTGAAGAEGRVDFPVPDLEAFPEARNLCFGCLAKNHPDLHARILVHRRQREKLVGLAGSVGGAGASAGTSSVGAGGASEAVDSEVRRLRELAELRVEMRRELEVEVRRQVGRLGLLLLAAWLMLVVVLR